MGRQAGRTDGRRHTAASKMRLSSRLVCRQIHRSSPACARRLRLLGEAPAHVLWPDRACVTIATLPGLGARTPQIPARAHALTRRRPSRPVELIAGDPVRRRRSCSATTPRTRCRRNTACWACRRSELDRHIAYDIGAAAVTRDAGAARLGAPARAEHLLAPADRPESGRGRPDAGHEALGRRHRARQRQRRRGRGRSAAWLASTRPMTGPWATAARGRARDGQAARHRVDPFLHAVLEGRPAPLARRPCCGTADPRLPPAAARRARG